MKSNDWLKYLMPGDRVILYHPMSVPRYSRTKVQTITPKGYIRVDGRLYRPETGEIRGDSWSRILDPDDPDNIMLMVTEERQLFAKRVMWKLAGCEYALSYKQAKQIAEILGWDEQDVMK